MKYKRKTVKSGKQIAVVLFDTGCRADVKLRMHFCNGVEHFRWKGFFSCHTTTCWKFANMYTVNY